MISHTASARQFRRVLAILFLFAIAAGTIWTFRPEHSSPGLVLYAATGYAPEVARAFTRKTGISVTLINMSTGPLLARVSAEGHRPAWSLVWFDGDAAAAALDHAGLLAKQSIPPLSWTASGRALLPADGSYTPTGITLAGVFMLPVGAGLPADPWGWLQAPDATGHFGLANPQLSGPAYVTLAGMLAQHGGWPQGQGYVDGLQKNGMRLYPVNGSVLQALEAHQISIAVVQSSAAFALANKNHAYRVVIPTPAAILPSVIAIAADQNPARTAQAEAFIRFVMSPEIQKLRMSSSVSDSLYWPVTEDAPAPSHLPPLAGITLLRLDPIDWGRREAEIGTWFDGITQP
jgi:iron(III) transport system substrate-binding protein